MKKVEHERVTPQQLREAKERVSALIDSYLPYQQTCSKCGGDFIIESRDDLFHWRVAGPPMLMADCPHCFKEVYWEKWPMFEYEDVGLAVKSRGAMYDILVRPYVMLWRRIVGS